MFRVKGRSQITNFGAVNRGYEGTGRIIDETVAYLVYLLRVKGVFQWVKIWASANDSRKCLT